MAEHVTVTIEVPETVVQQAKYQASSQTEYHDHLIDRLQYNWVENPDWYE